MRVFVLSFSVALLANALVASSVSPSSSEGYVFVETDGIEITGNICEDKTVRGEDAAWIREAYMERRLAAGGPNPGSKELVGASVKSLEGVTSLALSLMSGEGAFGFADASLQTISSAQAISGNADDSTVASTLFGTSSYRVTTNGLDIAALSSGSPLMTESQRAHIVAGASRLSRTVSRRDVLACEDDAMHYSMIMTCSGDPGSSEFDGYFVPSANPRYDPVEYDHADRFEPVTPSYSTRVYARKMLEFGWTSDYNESGDLEWDEGSVERNSVDEQYTVTVSKNAPAGSVGCYFTNFSAMLAESFQAKAFVVCWYSHTRQIGSGEVEYVKEATVIVPVTASPVEEEQSSPVFFPPRIGMGFDVVSVFNQAKLILNDTTVSPSSTGGMIPDVSQETAWPQIGDFPTYAGEHRLTSNVSHAEENASITIRHAIVVVDYTFNAREL